MDVQQHLSPASASLQLALTGWKSPSSVGSGVQLAPVVGVSGALHHDPKLSRRLVALVATTALFAVMLVSGVAAAPSGAAAVDPCGRGGNPIACENTKPGTPQATGTSPGRRRRPSRASRPTSASTSAARSTSRSTPPRPPTTIDIYRIGYYGGNGARQIATVDPSASLPQTQPACVTDAADRARTTAATGRVSASLGRADAPRCPASTSPS